MSTGTLNFLFSGGGVVEDHRSIFYFNLRKMSIARFGPTFVEGVNSFQICGGLKRHFCMVKKRNKEHYELLPVSVPCDGVSCKDAIVIENASEAQLVQFGVMEKLSGDVLVFVNNSMRRPGYTLAQAGDIIYPEARSNAIVLKPGQSTTAKRELYPEINLTPIGVRNRRDMIFVREVVDTIVNVNGKAVITSTETDLRKQADALREEAHRQAEQYEEIRTSRKKDFARGVSAYLKSCGFTYNQVGELFRIAGPGQCRQAVEKARYYMKCELEESRLDADKDEYRAIAGALYILSVGGVPADKKS